MTATVTSANTRLPALAGPLACGCCLLVGTAYVVANDPSTDGGFFLECPFRALTGQWCPGCGLTRATHHLFRGDIAQALHYNAFVVFILALLSATWLAWALSAAGRSLRWVSRIPKWVTATAGIVLLTFAVVRNLPGVDGLRG